MNKPIKIIFWLLLILLVTWGVVSISVKNYRQEGIDEPIRIGAISGLRGDFAVVGENWQKGVRLAYETYKENHPEVEIILFEEDSAFEAKRGVSAYNKLVDVDGVDAIINFDSVTINSVYDLAVDDGLPLVQGGEQAIAPIDDNIIQIQPGYTSGLREYGEYMKRQGYKDIGLFYTQEPTIELVKEAFENGFQGNMIEYPLSPERSSDFRTEISKALGNNHERIFILMFPQQGASLVKEMAELSKGDVPPLMFDAIFQTGQADYERILGNLSILDGSIVMVTKNTTAEWFKEQFRERYGEEPGTLTDIGYDAFDVLLKTYDSNREVWLMKLKEYKGEGASGSILFNEVGVRTPEFDVVTIIEGELIGIE